VESFVTKKEKRCSVLCDPRPQKFRNRPGYSDFVRSSVINYAAETQDDVTIHYLYLYQQANLQAAGHDHDYCEVPFLEHQVDRANQLNTEEAADLEKATRSQSRSSLWHAARKWRLTASNFGRITKCMSTRSRQRLAAHLAKPAVLFTKAVLHGKKYESVALKRFEELKDIKVHPAGLFFG